MRKLALIPLAFFLLLLIAAPRASAEEAVDVAGLWRGTLYGSELEAVVEQDGNWVKGVVTVKGLDGVTTIYHVVGAIYGGHMVMLHGAGHVFEGDVANGEVSGVLTTHGGSKISLRAARIAGGSGNGGTADKPAEEGSMAGDGRNPG